VLASVAAGCASHDPALTGRLLSEAADDARAAPDTANRATTLAAVAMTCATMAPGRDEQLFAEAERAVRTITADGPARMNAWLRIAAAAAGKQYEWSDDRTYGPDFTAEDLYQRQGVVPFPAGYLDTSLRNPRPVWDPGEYF
jgi:hypothetical protein